MSNPSELPTPTSPIASKANTVIAYTDGACKGNPGAGGWGVYLKFADDSERSLYGGADDTTNNRMELTAAIEAIKHTPSEQRLELWTDSSYVKQGITQWIHNWKQKNWRKADGKAVLNQDLWQQLDSLSQNRDIDWHWVKGHAGHAGNECADALANLGVQHPDGNHSGSHIDHSNSNRNGNGNGNGNGNDDGNDGNNSNSHNPIDTLSPHTETATQRQDWLDKDPLGWGEADSDSELDLPTNGSDDNQPDGDTTPSTIEHSLNHEAINEDAINHEAINHKPINNNVINDSEINSSPAIAFDGDTSRANPNFVPLLPTAEHRHDPDRQLIMDTETTGLDAGKGDRIIEVGIVELVRRKFTGTKLHVYINPERGMDEEVIRIHGISEAFLADKPTFASVAQALYDFMDGAELIAHNAPFDMSFLSMEFAKVGMDDFADRVRVTDSLALAKQQYPGQKNTLDALVKRLNVGKQDRTFHGALLDSEILAEVYLAMTGGQVALAIDEETSSIGGGAHATFAHLSDQLLVAADADADHAQWLQKMVADYPALQHTWDTDIGLSTYPSDSETHYDTTKQ